MKNCASSAMQKTGRVRLPAGVASSAICQSSLTICCATAPAGPKLRVGSARMMITPSRVNSAGAKVVSVQKQLVQLAGEKRIERAGERGDDGAARAIAKAGEFIEPVVGVLLEGAFGACIAALVPDGRRGRAYGRRRTAAARPDPAPALGVVGAEVTNW